MFERHSTLDNNRRILKFLEFFLTSGTFLWLPICLYRKRLQTYITTKNPSNFSKEVTSKWKSTNAFVRLKKKDSCAKCWKRRKTIALCSLVQAFKYEIWSIFGAKIVFTFFFLDCRALAALMLELFNPIHWILLANIKRDILFCFMCLISIPNPTIRFSS